jgi:3-methyladenine DNA glycosylase AlkD
MVPAEASAVIAHLKSMSNPVNVAGMARYGIRGEGLLGVSIPVLRGLARKLRPDHKLAAALWASRIHEARILAGMVDDPVLVTETQLEAWVLDFDSWGVCDQVCSNLFDRTPFARSKALQWSRREEEYVKRAGFVLMAVLAVHDKKAPDSVFQPFLARIKAEAAEGRELGAAADRQTQPDASRQGAGAGRNAVSREIIHGPLGRPRCAAGTGQRAGKGPAAEENGLNGCTP